jgi:hypothetical protein
VVTVTVAAEADETLIAVPMREENGQWTATITGLAHLSEVRLRVIAADAAGNLCETDCGTVKIEISAPAVGLELETAFADGVAVVSLQNHEMRAVSGLLVCAAYDEYGKLLAVGSRHLAVPANGIGECSVPVSCESPAEVKAFLLDVSGAYKPVC